MVNFEDEVIAAVEGGESVSRLTEDSDEEFDEFLLQQDIPKTEEEINSHFSKKQGGAK